MGYPALYASRKIVTVKDMSARVKTLETTSTRAWAAILALITTLAMMVTLLVGATFSANSASAAIATSGQMGVLTTKKKTTLKRLNATTITSSSSTLKSIRVTWKPRSHATHYEVVVRRANASAPVVYTAVTGKTVRKINGLKPGVKYKINVWALPQKNGKDTEKYRKSPKSKTLFIKTKPKPARVAKPSLNRDVTTVKVSWPKAKHATKYQVFVQKKNKSGKFGKSKKYTTKKTSYTVNGLKAKTRYRFTVRGLRGTTYGKKSKAAATTTLPNASFPYRLGMKGGKIKAIQQRLTWLGYKTTQNGEYNKTTENHVKRFQEKYLFAQTGQLTEAQWSKLKSVTNGKSKLPAQCRNKNVALMYCVDVGQRLTRQVRFGKVVDQVDTRTARPGKSTPRGTFNIYIKHRHWISTTYHVRMPFFMVFYASGGRIGFHYSDAFAASGYNGGSAGCVNIRDWGKIEKWFNQTPTGTPVHVYS